MNELEMRMRKYFSSQKKLKDFESESGRVGRSTERCAVVEEVALDRKVMRYRRRIS